MLWALPKNYDCFAGANVYRTSTTQIARVSRDTVAPSTAADSILTNLQLMSAWVDQIFRAAQSANGGVVRRSVLDVYQKGALDEILDRAMVEGWHVIETGDQIVVLCHRGRLNILC